MATIQKLARADGVRWRVHYREPGDPARTARYLGPFATKKQAEEARAELVQDHARRGPAAARLDPFITVRAYGELWLAAAGVKPKTLDSYRSSLDLHIVPALGDARVRDLTQGAVLRLLEEKLREPLRSKRKVKAGGLPQASPPGAPTLSISTVRIIYGTLRRLLSRARLDGIVRDNVALGVWRELAAAKGRRGRRRAAEDVKAMTVDQVTTLLTAAAPAEQLLWLVSYRQALRPGEAMGLQLDDVDLVDRKLHVRRTLHGGRRHRGRTGTPKSGYTRTVPLAAAVVEPLRVQLARRREELLAAGNQAGNQPPWLFALGGGQALDESRIAKAFKRTLKAAGLPLRFSPHSLRHTWASQMLNRGAPLQWVADFLGHSSAVVTLDWYSWALPEGGAQTVDLLDAIVPGGSQRPRPDPAKLLI